MERSRFLPIFLVGVCPALWSGCAGTPPGFPAPAPGLPPGATLWERELSAPGCMDPLRRAWACHGLVLLETTGGVLTGLRQADGGVVFRLALGQPVSHGPVGARGRVALATLDRLLVVEAASGTLLLDRPLDVLPSGPPCLGPGQVWLPTLGPERLVCFSLATGRRSAGLPPGPPLAAGPVLCEAGNALIVYLTEDGAAVGRPAAEGRGPSLWETPGVAGPGSLLSASGGMALISGPLGLLTALGGADGAVLWMQLPPAAAPAPPVSLGGLVLARSTEGLVCLDAGSGARLWTCPAQLEPVVLRKDGLYAAAGRSLVRLDPGTGRPTGGWDGAGLHWIRNETDPGLFGWSEQGRVIALGE